MTKNDEYIQTLIERERAQEWTKPCLEMVKLRELLDSAGIGWWDGSTKNGNKCIHRTISDKNIVIKAEGFERRAFVVTWGLFGEGAEDGLLEVTPWYGPASAYGRCDAERAFELCAKAVARARGSK